MHLFPTKGLHLSIRHQPFWKSATARTGQYIWRTQNDGKVRSSHAANNGRVFSWDSPPETGHPGEDYNCRCIAESYVAGKSEYANQVFLTTINDSSPAWGNRDYINHFRYGNGDSVSLSQTGNLGGVIDCYFHRLGRYNAVNEQIIDEARKHDSGSFFYRFAGSYSFGEYIFVFGNGTVSGLFEGAVKKNGGRISIEGNVHYSYYDEFTDIFSLREMIDGTSTPDNLGDPEFGGKSYAVVDIWITRFKAEVNVEASNSRYVL